MQYWMVKQEPSAYAWSALVNDGRTAWTGVRNYQARIHLRAMRVGDRVLYYHSVTEKQVVGVARVVREAYPDPTAEEGDWSCVDLEPVKALKTPVTIEQVKGDAVLREMPFLRQSRLSVSPLTRGQFERVMELSGTRLK